MPPRLLFLSATDTTGRRCKVSSYQLSCFTSALCSQRATPFSKPSGYHIPAPKQSGHWEASTLGTAADCSLALSSSICRFSFFQRRRRRCSARNAGTFDTIVRPAAIFNSVTSTSASSPQRATSACDGSLPVISVAAFFNAALSSAKASSSSFSVLVLKEVLSGGLSPFESARLGSP